MLSASSEPLSVPDPDGSPKTYPDKIHTIVDHISQLTLLEAAQLNELLKVYYIDDRFILKQDHHFTLFPSNFLL